MEQKEQKLKSHTTNIPPLSVQTNVSTMTTIQAVKFLMKKNANSSKNWFILHNEEKKKKGNISYEK